MSIQWNKVTWYSRILAVVLFVAVFYVGFWLGKDAKTVPENTTTPIKQTVATSTAISLGSKKITETNFTGTIPTVSGENLLATKARAYITKAVTDFRAQANTDVPAMRKQFGADSPTAQYEIDINAKYIKGTKTESIVLTNYAYTGGAHGNTSYKVFTANQTGTKILTLSEVIVKDQQTAFAVLVKKELNSWVPAGSDSVAVFPDYVNALNFASFANWSLDNSGLTLYFDQYEIGPGVLGEVAFPLSYDKIKTFLNPNF